jgi:hypothetical protein
MKRLLLTAVLIAGAAAALADTAPRAAKVGANSSHSNSTSVAFDQQASKLQTVRVERGVVPSDGPGATPKSSALPELQTLGLMGLGLLAIGLVTRRRLMD